MIDRKSSCTRSVKTSENNVVTADEFILFFFYASQIRKIVDVNDVDVLIVNKMFKVNSSC